MSRTLNFEIWSKTKRGTISVYFPGISEVPAHWQPRTVDWLLNTTVKIGAYMTTFKVQMYTSRCAYRSILCNDFSMRSVPCILVFTVVGVAAWFRPACALDRQTYQHHLQVYVQIYLRKGKGKRQCAVREGSEGSARTLTHSHALKILAHSLLQ